MAGVAVTVDSNPVLVAVKDVAVAVAVPQVSIVVATSGPPGPPGTGGGGSGGVIVDPGVPADTGFDLLWVDVDGTASGGGGGGGGVTDHGALTGLGDPDHPITAVQGLQAVLDGKAASAHSHTQVQSHGSPDTDQAASSLHHTLGTGATQAAFGNHSHTPAAVGAEPAGTVAAHEALADPHTGYLKPVDVVAGTNVTVTSTADTVTISATGGGGGVTVHNDLTGRSTGDAHPISAVTGLQTAIDGKAATGHLHTGTYWGLWSGTQAAYTALGTYDTNTLYVITP
jgi:hypothetical protein